MIFDFNYTLDRNDEEFTVQVTAEVYTEGRGYHLEYYVSILDVKYKGESLPVTKSEQSYMEDEAYDKYNRELDDIRTARY